jgi:hypothetical protein
MAAPDWNGNISRNLAANGTLSWTSPSEGQSSGSLVGGQLWLTGNWETPIYGLALPYGDLSWQASNVPESVPLGPGSVPNPPASGNLETRWDGASYSRDSASTRAKAARAMYVPAPALNVAQEKPIGHEHTQSFSRKW